MFTVQKVVRASKANTMNFNDKKGQFNRLPVGYIPRELRDGKDINKKFGTILDSIMERAVNKSH